MIGFAYPCGKRLPKTVMLTELLLPVENSSGVIEVQPIIVERLNFPSFGLQFTDFSIHECLKNGISVKSLAIQKDSRLVGLDEEIDKFNEKLNDYASVLFNPEN